LGARAHARFDADRHLSGCASALDMHESGTLSATIVAVISAVSQA
jgi:hypothetical protein